MVMDVFKDVYLDIVRMSPYFKDIYNRVSHGDFYSIFLNYDDANKTNFLLFYISIKVRDVNKLDEQEKLVINEVEKAFNNLYDKCRNNELNEQEAKALLSILANYSLEGLPIPDDILSIYLNNYLFVQKRFYVADEIVLLTNYMVMFLNQLTNSNIRLNYTLDYINSLMVMGKKDGNYVLNVRANDLRLIMMRGKLQKDAYCYILLFQAYAILHEYLHTKYMQWVIDGTDFGDLERIKKEMIIIINNHEFYEANHDSFIIEKDADQFALKYLKSMLKGILSLSEYEKAMEQLKVVLDKLYAKIDPNFEEKLEEEYKKIVMSDEELKSMLK